MTSEEKVIEICTKVHFIIKIFEHWVKEKIRENSYIYIYIGNIQSG